MYPLGTIQGLLLDPCITKLFIHFHEKKFSTGLFFFPFLLLFWGLSCFFMVYGIPLQSIKRCLEITWCHWVPYFHTLTEKKHWRKEFDSQVYTSKKRTCKRRNKARSARWFEPFLALSCILLCKRCIFIWWIHLNTVSSFIKKIFESINILVCQMAWGLESSWKSLERLCVIYRTCCVISRVNKYIYFMLSYQILYHYYSNEQIRSSRYLLFSCSYLF